jgi:hypothetical protein
VYASGRFSHTCSIDSLERPDHARHAAVATFAGRRSLFDREVADPLDGAGPLRGVLSALEKT